MLNRIPGLRNARRTAVFAPLVTFTAIALLPGGTASARVIDEDLKALVDPQPMQPGDVRDTFADISAIERDHGFRPTTTIDEGVPRFVQWYREYHGV